VTAGFASSQVPLDHVLIYGGFQLDGLCDFFEKAGFVLTPLGKHNYGSVNRLAVLDHQYIELIGFLEGTPDDVRPEVQALPLGLNGLAAGDLPGYDRKTGGKAFAEALHLERVIDTDIVKGVARFTITHVKEPVRDARAFLCRHHTPDLLWVKEWMQHANSASSIKEVLVPTRFGPQFRKVVDAVFDVNTEDGGATCCAGDTIVRIAPAEAPGSVTILAPDLDAAVAVFRNAGLSHEIEADRVRLPLPECYRSELIFRQN